MEEVMQRVLDNFKNLLTGVVDSCGGWKLNEYQSKDVSQLQQMIVDSWPETYDSKEERHRTALALLALADDLLDDTNYDKDED